MPSNAEVFNFQFIIGPYLHRCGECTCDSSKDCCSSCDDFEARAYLLVSQDDSFIDSFKKNLYDNINNNNYYTQSMRCLLNADFFKFTFNGSRDKKESFNSIDLMNLFANVSNKYSGFVKHLGIVIMPDAPLSGTNFFEFNRSQLTLSISYRIKVIGDVKLLLPKTITTQSVSQSAGQPALQAKDYAFDDSYYFAGIELTNINTVENTFTLNVDSSDFFTTSGQYEAFDMFKIKGGESQYIELNGIIKAKVLRITNSNNVFPDVNFYGSKYIGISSPLISAGLGGYGNKTYGNGFQIQLNNDNKIVATVVTKESIYSASIDNPTTVPFTLTLVWSKQNDTLMLYCNEVLAIGSLSNISSIPFLYNEYLLVYGDYYNYSDLNTALSGIKLWSFPLSYDDLSDLQKEEILDWRNLDTVPAGFKHGSDCYCKNVICPCETLNFSSTVEYTSRLSDIFLMTNDDYFSEDTNVYILNNSATYFDNIVLDFSNVKLQQVFIEGSLVSNKSADCSNITMQFENSKEKAQTKWCGIADFNDTFSTPDLVSLLIHLLKLVNYTQPLTIIVMFDGVVLQPESFLRISYFLPNTDGFIHASAIQVSSQDLLASISLKITGACFSFQFKFGGSGFVSLAVLGYTNSSSEELAFFYRREGLDRWVKSSIDLRNYNGIISFVALKNGLGIGYIALSAVNFVINCDELPINEDGENVQNALGAGNPIPYSDGSFFASPAILVKGYSKFLTSFPNPNVSASDATLLRTLYGSILETSNETLYFSEVDLSLDFTFAFWYKSKLLPYKVFSFLYGIEVKIFLQASTISLNVDNLQKSINVISSSEWHYIVVQYERKFLKLSFEVDFSTSVIFNGVQFPQNSSMEIFLENSVFCFQMFNEILFQSALKAAQLCIKSVENACTKKTSECQWCNPLYGEWELYPWEYIFDKNGNCLLASDDFNKTLYLPFNTAIDLSNLARTSDGLGAIKSILPGVKSVLGFINNGLLIESNNVVVADLNIQYYVKSLYTFSAWVKHTCEIENNYQPIISTSLFVLLCGDIDTNVPAVIPTLVFHDNCLYPLPGKSGLWYNFAFVYNETISVYIDGELVSKTECLNTSLSFESNDQEKEFRVWSVGLNTTMLDEIFIGDVAPKTLFWRQLAGNLNSENIKQMTKPSRFNLTSKETWIYESSLRGSYLYERVVAVLVPQITELLRLSISEFLLLEVSMQLVPGKKVFCDLDIYLAVQSNDVFKKIAEALNNKVYIAIESQTLTLPENSFLVPTYPSDLLADSTKSDDLLEYYSKVASYSVLFQNRTFVAISLDLFEDVRYPISQVYIQWTRVDNKTTNQKWSNQTNFIIISPLQVYTEYYVCFSFETIRRKMSLCTQQNKTIWTAEGEPVETPSLNCSANQANKTMTCDIGKINSRNWIGVPYSYNLVYRLKTPDDNCNNTERDSNHYNIIHFNTTTDKQKLRVTFDTSDYHFLQLCVFAYATTQGGNGIGVAKFIVIRTQSTAPDVAPNGLSATFNTSEINFDWHPLENDIDIWNDVKVPGLYNLTYGMVNSILPYVNAAGSYSLTNGIINSILPSALISVTTVTVNGSQYIFKNASQCYIWFAFVNAYSVAKGPASPIICYLSPLTKPDCVKPVIKEYYVVDPRTAVFLPDTFDPTYFRGVSKSWLFHVEVDATSYYPGPIALDYRNISYNLQVSIEYYTEASVKCDEEKLLMFPKQPTSNEISLMGLHPYTSYHVSIQPCNEYGCGKISNTVSFTTYSDTPNCSPENLQLDNDEYLTMYVLWYPPNKICHNGILENYILSCSGEQSDLSDYVTTGTNVQLTNLHNYELICCQVAASNINGTGPNSSKICTRTPEAEPDAVPTPSKIEMTSFTGCITIQPPDPFKMNGVVLGIRATITNVSLANSSSQTSRLQRRFLPFSQYFEFNFTAIELYEALVNISFENLLPSFLYNIELQYFNSIGNGPWSDAYQIVTQEYYSEAPDFISFSSDDVKVIKVNWSSVPIEKSNGIISQYIICRKQLFNSSFIGEEVCFNYTDLSVLEFNLTDLGRGSTHNVSVAACNKAGCGKKIYINASAMGFTDGQWLEWSEWAACSKTCDQGLMKRTRLCTPYTEGGYDCFGNDTDFTSCQRAKCSGFVLGSDGETNCTAVCAKNKYVCSTFYLKPYNDTSIFLAAVTPINCQPSLAYRVYSSDLDPSYDSSAGVCYGYINVPDEVPCESKSNFNQPKMQRLCNCISPADYGFTNWAKWSVCSATCGKNVVKIRKRYCMGTCVGNFKEVEKCENVPLCPVDGEWGKWGDYSECNTTCGYGYRIRTRECNNPSPVGTGTPCQGIYRDEKPECNAFPCPVDGGYSNWTDWSICSRPCGEGVMTSRRYCNNPTPALRGKECNGSDIMTMPCFIKNCTAVQVDLTQRTLEVWEWKMYDINSKESRAFVQRFTESINMFFNNNNLNGFQTVVVTRLQTGSIIVDYTLKFDYLHDQMIEFIDGINQAGKITNISIDSTQYYSSNDVSCPPPYNISVESYDKNTVLLKWVRDACIANIWLYVYYKDISSANSTWEWRGLDSNKTSGFVPDLVTSHKYKAYMLTALDIGNGVPSTVFYFETSVSPPERPPPVATTYSRDPTEIYVEWTDIPVKYCNGKILGYRIKYKIYTKKEKYQVAEAQFGFNAFTLKNLKPFTLYLVEVYGYNANGNGPVQYSMCKTIEGVPSIPVPNFVVNDLQSISWWSVAWGPIPSEFVNGILLGYRLVYYLSHRSGVEISGEKTKITIDFDTYTRYYKQRDVLNYAIYSVSVAGFTTAGSGPAPEYQARTCKCAELLFANLCIKKPFTSKDNDNNPSGFFLTLLQEMVIRSCGSCQAYSSSQLYFTQSKSGEDTIKGSEFDLKNAINEDVDLSFPIYGMNGREVAPDSEFSMLVMSPGISMVVRNENTLDQVIIKMVSGVLDVWPVLLISYAIASVFGIVIWFTDQFSNPDQFSKGSSLRGPLSGFWFTFVTMTTIGYGDLSPRSVLARTFAMVWFLTGLILNGLIIAFIVTNLTTLSSSKEYMLYNTKVAALNNSLELKIAITRNAEIPQERYTSILSMFEDLQNKVVDIVYVDTISLLDYGPVLDEKSLTIIAVDNINVGYGFVMSGASAALTIDINSFISSKSNEISAFATSFSSRVPGLLVQDSSQIIADIFSETSPAFQSSLIYLGVMIALFAVGAFTFEIIMRRKKGKMSVDAAFKEQFIELKQYISDFRDEFTKVTDKIVCQHDEEIVCLVDLKKIYKNKIKRIGIYETEKLVDIND